MGKEDKDIFIISSFKKSKFYDQLEWADDLIQKESHYLFNNDFKVFDPREIYEYIQRFDSSNRINLLGKCVILDRSTKYENKVLVCPIYPKSYSINKFGLNIGKIYGLNEEEYIAAISEIKFISKRRFKLNDKSISDAQNICYLSTCAYLSILEAYKRIIDTIIKRVNDNSLFSYQNAKYLSA